MFSLIKYIGAAYLIWLGIGLIRSSFEVKEDSVEYKKTSDRKCFLQGFVTHGSNPKLLLFFTAIIPQFVNPSANVELQLTILGVSALVIQTIILSAYSFFAGKTGELATPRVRQRIQQGGGLFLIGAGAGLAVVGKEQIKGVRALFSRLKPGNI